MKNKMNFVDDFEHLVERISNVYRALTAIFAGVGFVFLTYFVYSFVSPMMNIPVNYQTLHSIIMTVYILIFVLALLAVIVVPFKIFRIWYLSKKAGYQFTKAHKKGFVKGFIYN